MVTLFAITIFGNTNTGFPNRFASKLRKQIILIQGV